MNRVNMKRLREILRDPAVQVMALIPLGLGLCIGLALAATPGIKFKTTLGGSESFLDLNNPTGAAVSLKLLATAGLAAGATTVVGSLPACATATKGYLYIVTDASSPTFGGTLTGGSTTMTLALCNGTNWVGA